MSADLEIARFALDKFSAGELAEFWALIAPDCVLRTDPAWPGGGEYSGTAEMKRFIGQFLEAFGAVRFDYEGQPEEVNGRVLLHGRWVGSGASTGIEAETSPVSVVIAVFDGLVSRFDFFFSDEEARHFAASDALDAN